MKEVFVRAWCDDPTEVHGENRVAASSEETIPIGGKEYMFDLCTRCSEHVMGMLHQWASHGSVVSKKNKTGPKPGTPANRTRTDGTPDSYRTCPECGLLSVSRDSLGQHVISKHGKGLKEFEWEYDPRSARREAGAATAASGT